MREENEENLRFKFVSIWHRSTTRKPRNLSKHAHCRTESSRMFYSPVACCIPLLFPLRFYYFLTQTGWFPPTTALLTCLWHCCFRRELCRYSAIFLPAKSTRFSTPELWFSCSVMSEKTVGRGIPRVSARGPLLF